MADQQRTINGIIPAVMTPLADDGSIDMQALEKQMVYLTEAGVHGLFIGGTTSEGPFLTPDERKEVFKLAKEIAGGRIPLYVVILRPHTDKVIEELMDFMDLQPDFAAAVTPFYYGVSQSTIVEHYTRIAEASPIPVLLYNIPQNTHNAIGVDTVLELAKHPNIVGVKDSSGNFIDFTRGILSTTSDQFAWIQGEDRIDGPSFLLGAPALVTGLGNVRIEPYIRMYDAAQRGDTEAVLAEQRIINAMARIIPAADGAVIPSIKMAASLFGRGSARMRIAADTLPDTLKPTLQKILKEAGVG